MAWTGKPDHLLIGQINGRFDVFLTIDKGFEFEHGIENFTFGVVIATAVNNQMVSYERMLDELIWQAEHVLAGRVVHVKDPYC
jgi:hypothetical protein